MSFIFSDIQPGRSGMAKPSVPSGLYYSTAFKQGLHDSMLGGIYRMSEYWATLEEDPIQNPPMSREEAYGLARTFGVTEDDLAFTDGMTKDEVMLLTRRKQAEKERSQILSVGSNSFGRKAGMMGTAFLGSIANPLDLALMFIPVVGNAGKAASLAKNGRTVASFLAKGLITEEALAARGMALKGYTAAMLEGAIGQAITEIPTLAASYQDQSEYTWENSAMNVGLGALFGAGINTMRLSFRGAKTFHDHLSKTTKENMATGAMDDFLKGQDLDPARFVEFDDMVIDGRLSERALEQLERLDAKFKGKLEEMTPEELSTWSWLKDNKLKTENGMPVVVYRPSTSRTSIDPGDPGVPTKSKFGYFFAGSPRSAQSALFMASLRGDERAAAIIAELEPLYKKMAENPEKIDQVLFEQLDNLEKQLQKLGYKQPLRKGANMRAYMVKMRNPVTIDMKGAVATPEDMAAIVQAAKEAGHDGIVFKNASDGETVGESYLVFNENNFKSAYEYNSAKNVSTLQEEIKSATERFNEREAAKERVYLEQLEKERAEVDTPEGEKFLPADRPTEAEIKQVDAEIEQLLSDLEDLGTDADLPNPKSPNRYGPPVLKRSKPRTAHEELADFSRWTTEAYWRESAGAGKYGEYTVADFAVAIEGSYPRYHRILKVLMENNPDLKDLHIEFDDYLLPQGVYHPREDYVAVQGETKGSTILHEIIHAVMYRRVHNWFSQDMEKAFGSQMRLWAEKGDDYIDAVTFVRDTPKSFNKSLVELSDLYLRAIDAFETRMKLGVQEKVNTNLDWVLANAHYGLYNIDEFITEALTDKEFQRFLGSVKTGEQTIIQKLVRIVRDLLGMQGKSGTLLEETLEAIEKGSREGTRTDFYLFDDVYKPKANADDLTAEAIAYATTCIT